MCSPGRVLEFKMFLLWPNFVYSPEEGEEESLDWDHQNICAGMCVLDLPLKLFKLIAAWIAVGIWDLIFPLVLVGLACSNFLWTCVILGLDVFSCFGGICSVLGLLRCRRGSTDGEHSGRIFACCWVLNKCNGLNLFKGFLKYWV